MMKTIGLLGGTGWSSTITYYRMLNELVHKRLGGYHSAKILLKSIDYHDIMNHYGQDHQATAHILQQELSTFLLLKPDCLIICCNSLHKYYDHIAPNLAITIPVLHAVHLVADEIKQRHFQKVLLLATKFTMEDGFFAQILEEQGIQVIIPNLEEREHIKQIHDELMQNQIHEKSQNYFEQLIAAYKSCDAVVLGCTEYSLLVNPATSILPIIDSACLQARHAVDYALS
jgi:aspartate racemase